MGNNRLLNKLFEDETFLVDETSVPYIVRDIINMNWWNTCDYLMGYEKNKRVSKAATFNQKLQAVLLKEYYRENKALERDADKFKSQLRNYILGESTLTGQLKLYSAEYRRNDSQYYFKDGKTTWLDCTSRATYAWKYIAQNGYIDWDGICRVKDANKIIDLIKLKSIYPKKEEALNLFSQGNNLVKQEIFSQKNKQLTVDEWVRDLSIQVLPSRQWLFDLISHVKTDPYKNNEKALLKQGQLIGNNELLYGLKTFASCSIDTSSASAASSASSASSASRASFASDASYASHASDAGSTREPLTLQSWFDAPTALGELAGLDHPPVFAKNKFGLAGHWKINKEVVESCHSWIDPFMGHGESPIYAKRCNKNFVGIEINPDSMNGYLLPFVQEAVNKYGNPDTKVELRLGDSTIFYQDLANRFDLCYTSPPYFNFEDYGFHNKIVQECVDYDEYHERVTRPVFDNVYHYLTENGILALQTEKPKTLKAKWVQVLSSLGFKLILDTVTGQEEVKYSNLSKRDQTLLLFTKEKR